MSDQILTTARLALEHGMCPVPPRNDGTKAPAGKWKQRQTVRPTLDELEREFADAHGIGLVCGAISGNLEMLEFEGRAAHLWPLYVAACRNAGHGDLIDQVATGYFETTPSGGGHLLWCCTGAVDGNLKLARRIDPDTAEIEVLIETRGEGGYVVIAPSNGATHPTGLPWVLKAGGLDQVATITPEQRLALLDIARTFDQLPDTPPASTPSRTQNEGSPEQARTAPIQASPDSWMDATQEAFNQATTWAALLGAHGWTHHHHAGGVDYWTRPGKETRDGHSATTNANGTDRLIVFSSSVGDFRTADGNGPAPSYDRFAAWATLEHGGDRHTAALAARRDGHGPPLEQHTVVDEAGLQELANGDDEPWPAPQPLGIHVGPLPGFPIDTLPTWITQQAHDVARQLQVPVDLPALLAIGALSAAVAGKARLQVADGWREHLNIYLAIAMPPSSGKSPAAKAMFHPVEELEAELTALHKQAAAEANQRKKIAEKRAKDLEAKAAKTGTKADVDAAVQAFLDAENAELPKSPRLLSDDATPEALTRVLADNDGRITIASTEGGLFELMTGRYSDGRANLDVYLKAWSNDPIRVDRIGRPPVHIPQPVVTVALAVQPDVLRALGDRPELAGRGLTARFMYALPVDLVGQRDLTTPRDHSHIARRTYNEQLLGIGRRFARAQHPSDLRLAPDAAALYGTWRQSLEERRRPDGDLRPYAEWTGKLEGTVLRVAGLLHIADDKRSNEPVDHETMTRAITIAGYWLHHALAVHQMWKQDPVVADAHRILAWIDKKQLTTFKHRELMTGVHALRDDGKTKTAPQAHAALQRLMDDGWLRTDDRRPVEPKRGSGHTAQGYLVHPHTSRAFRSFNPIDDPPADDVTPDTERAERAANTPEKDPK